MPLYQRIHEQSIPASVQSVWEFIANPNNLKRITPDHMGFEITSSHTPDRMYEGMIVAYKVQPFKGFSTEWVTEITHLEEGAYFVDEQRLGPYRLWHHQHLLEPISNGVLMKDIVSYVPPFGFLGAVANKLLIRKKLDGIFSYRQQAIVDIFGRIEQEPEVAGNAPH